ncbi:hypothetical protein G6F55_013952 [Rhizopus delemar]|nr:hypothetical protein G6F55_013952 [Rhizopus delemar]
MAYWPSSPPRVPHGADRYRQLRQHRLDVPGPDHANVVGGVVRAAGAVGHAESAELASGPRHPRAEKRRRHGRIHGREHGRVQGRDLRLGGTAGLHFGLALRAHAARRQPQPLRPELRH